MQHPIKPVQNRRQITINEWLFEGYERFGQDRNAWKFCCPSCGHKQSGENFIPLGIDPNQAYFSCLGRYVGNVGCNWTLGGLLQIHTTEVLFDGDIVRVFEFAEAELYPQP